MPNIQRPVSRSSFKVRTEFSSLFSSLPLTPRAHVCASPCTLFLNPCPDSSPKGRPNNFSCSLHTSCHSCDPEVVTPSHREPGNPAKPTFNPITQTGKSDRLLQSGGLSRDHKSKAYPKPPLAQRLGPAACCGKNIPEGQPASNCRWSFRPSDCQ